MNEKIIENLQFDTYKPNLKNTHFHFITCNIKIVVV